MNIDTTTLDLIPVQGIKQPVPADKHNGIIRFHHNHNSHKSQMASSEYRPKNWGVSYGPSGRGHKVSVIKGRIVDIFA